MKLRLLVLAAPLAMAAQDAPVQSVRAGILCELALGGWAEQVAERCTPQASPEMRAALHDSVARIGAYVRAHSDWTEAGLAAFVRDQDGGNDSDAKLCDNGDARHIQASLAQMTLEKVRAETDAALATPREITMDPCL